MDVISVDMQPCIDALVSIIDPETFPKYIFDMVYVHYLANSSNIDLNIQS